MAEMLARPAGLEPATPSLEGLGLQLRSADVCGSGEHDDKNEGGTKGFATRVAPELHREPSCALTRLHHSEAA